MLGFAVTVLELWSKIEGRARAGSGCTLAPLEFAEIYMAPPGKLPRVPSSVSWLYLAGGLRLFIKTGNPTILRMMLFAVGALGNIATGDTINRFRKELVDMDSDVNLSSDIVRRVDELTGGQYSRNLAINKALEEEIKSKDAVIKSKDAVIKSKDAVIKSKDAIIKSKAVANKSKDAIIKSKAAANESKDAEN
ncbi:MAG: hypothetical protein LBQ12_13900 [Deltaproteobacteria bacterium]|jgi:hypothetical protein|nr:hypothetical protein [Deltaproteobacteria bacterium]